MDVDEYDELIVAIADLAEELSKDELLNEDGPSERPHSKLYAVMLDINAAIGKRMRDLREGKCETKTT